MVTMMPIVHFLDEKKLQESTKDRSAGMVSGMAQETIAIQVFEPHQLLSRGAHGNVVTQYEFD